MMTLADLFNSGTFTLPEVTEIKMNAQVSVRVYPHSVRRLQDTLFFMGKSLDKKFLYIVCKEEESNLSKEFSGTLMPTDFILKVKECPLNWENAKIIQEKFSFTRPQLIGLQNSFGFGDRLGLANPGHLRALMGSGFKPVLAQQSIRELQRTQRQPEEVMSAAVWAVFQEGFEEGFGADADHLKTTEDIDRMMNAGFTMFTIDPSDYVNNAADSLSLKQLESFLEDLPWKELRDTVAKVENRYVDMIFTISEKFSVQPDRLEVYRALVKYGRALAHIRQMAEYLKTTYPHRPIELEISIDETEAITTPFEHFFIANELKRMGIVFISLAPHFIGRFEKGVDYKGDIEVFREEYYKHLQIVDYFKSYKLSLHSGSDKFRVYKVIGSFKNSLIHVKTAGTSYLEALRVLAVMVPDFFREIWDFCHPLYEQEKKSYHVSADVSQLKASSEYTDSQLLALFTDDNARQVLHVTFGRVLTERQADGTYRFRDKILQYLNQYEEYYYQFLVEHFKKHLAAFGK